MAVAKTPSDRLNRGIDLMHAPASPPGGMLNGRGFCTIFPTIATASPMAPPSRTASGRPGGKIAASRSGTSQSTCRT
ncbi:hypothetical protein AGR6A_Cc50016 [Agrobacterium sp. NCPPB 925]|nr:hypothetical protein AGR6A_Cc50016 [Agrobacterium sp. NCPPB 925]